MRAPKAFKFDSERVMKAYRVVRRRLAKDPLFMRNARAFEVSLEELDARMQRVPKSSAEFSAWLDGADQYRYAGLAVLFEAFGRSAAERAFPKSLSIGENRTLFFAGDVTIHGELTLASGAMIIVLGTLCVDGSLFADRGYTLVAAQRLKFESGLTSGEVIALDRIEGGAKVYLSDTDHSCRAPTFEAGVLVDFERGNAFGKVVATKRVKKWSFPAAARALELSEEEDLQAAFKALLEGRSVPVGEVKPPSVDPEALWEAARNSPPTLARLLPGKWSGEQVSVALEYAAQWDQPKAVQLLLTHGGRPHAHRALSSGLNSVPVLDLLLDACGRQSEEPIDGRPLLHLAANIGDSAVVARLLERGADVNATDRLGVTALHVCAWHGKVAAAKILLEHGAAKDRKLSAAWHDYAAKGATPLDVAREQAAQQSAAKPWRDLVKLLA
jgi:Ankyrin repeats (3 copies)